MKGILFKPDMLKAIVEGRKDITRRIAKYDPEGFEKPTIKQLASNDKWYVYDAEYPEDGAWEVKPPYLPGEVVYVKEGWCVEYDGGQPLLEDGKYRVLYRSTNPETTAVDEDGGQRYTKAGYEASPWKSPLIMPAWAARYWLRINGVRAERLQDITEGEAKREGLRGGSAAMGHTFTHRELFIGLWDSIYGPGSWDKNPWVWRIEFELLKEHP